SKSNPAGSTREGKGSKRAGGAGGEGGSGKVREEARRGGE
ncbi:unnamed protein product, partial [Urochloa humidicola]